MPVIFQVNNFNSRNDNKILSFGAKTSIINSKSIEGFSNKISNDALMLHLKKLTSPEMEGRGVGFRGIELAKKYIASEFKKIGLEPFAPLKMKNYFDSFKMEKYDTYIISSIDSSIDKNLQKQEGAIISQPEEVKTSNILGMIKGKKYLDNYLFITAHYDHLGKSPEGVIFPGADDNASSVSALLEIARCIKEDGNNKKSIVFVALTGEEDGLVGSKMLAKKLQKLGLGHKIEVLNLEMLASKTGNVLDCWKEKVSLTKNLVKNLKFATDNIGVNTKMHFGDAGSDAYKFNYEDIPAITVCWNYDVGRGHPNLHTNMDNYENVNPVIFTKAAKTVAAISYVMVNSVPNALALKFSRVKNNVGRVINKRFGNKVA